MLVAVSVCVAMFGSGVVVGKFVEVAVTGIGDTGNANVGVDVASGINSTNEIDNAPTIKPTETNATNSAFPNSRKRITSYPFYFYSAILFFRQPQATTH